MKKSLRKILSVVFLICMCITYFNISAFAYEENTSQTEETNEPIMISEFQYKNLNSEITRKQPDDQELSGKSDVQTETIIKALPYELKKENLEIPFMKSELEQYLPEYIIANIGSESMEVPVTWNLADFSEEIQAGIYMLSPQIPVDYILDKNIQNNNIELSVSYRETEKNETLNDVVNPDDGNAKQGEEKANKTIDDVVDRFEIEWNVVQDSPNSTVDGDTLTMKPKNDKNYTGEVSQALGQIHLGLSNIPFTEAKGVQIRIPRSIFTDRDGDSNGDVEIGKFVTETFDYEIDKETNEIVIYNTVPVSDAVSLDVQLNYQKEWSPSSYQNNSEFSWNAKLSINNNDIQGEMQSNTLKIKHEIYTDLVSVSLKKVKKYEKWHEELGWGAKPENSDEYIYVLWGAQIRIGDNFSSMPYAIEIENITQNNGKIIGWGYDGADIDTNSSYEEEITPDSSEKDLLNMSSPEYKSSIKEDKSHRFYHYFTILIQYPRREVETNKDISDEVKVTLNPLYSEDNVAAQERTANAIYTYQSLEFVYPPGNFSVKKEVNGRGSELGLVNKIQESKDTEKITTSIQYVNSLDIIAGDLTYDPETKEYGKRNYYLELVDDLPILEGEKLEEDDYSFSEFRFAGVAGYQYVVNEDTGAAKKEKLSNKQLAEKNPEIYFEYRIANTETWIKGGSRKMSENGSVYYETDSQDVTAIGTTGTFILPEHVVAVRMVINSNIEVIECAYSLDGFNIYTTDHVKKLLDRKNDVELINVNTLGVKNSEDIWVSAGGSDSILGNLKPIVEERDQAYFGSLNYGQHDYDALQLKPMEISSEFQKESGVPSDDGEGWRLHYTLIGNEYFRIGNVYDSDEVKDMFDSGEFVHHNKGTTFYDLLPKGTYIDTSSIEVLRCTDTIGDHAEKADYDFTVRLEENWRNSNRTMVIIDVTVPEGEENYYSSNGYYGEFLIGSGLGVSFSVTYPIESYVDYGGVITNHAAYKLHDGKLNNGYPDDPQHSGFTDDVKEYFKDLDGDGNVNPRNDTKYGQCSNSVSSLLSVASGYEKRVKNPEEISYTLETTAVGGGDYSYQIRLTNGNKSSADYAEIGNIVMFDILESAHADNGYWKGILESVDTSQPEITKDIKPVVYYSTTKDLQLSEDLQGELKEDADITNQDIWSTSMPENKNEITAVAVDLRNKKDGSEFLLGENASLSVILNMNAPDTDIQEKVDDRAYNDAWISKTDHLMAGEQNRTLKTLVTEVAIREPVLSIAKESDPETGTPERPTEVNNNDTILYDVSVKNEELSAMIKNIVVEDTIPDGLTIKDGEIEYYLSGDSKKPVNDDFVKLEKSGQKLVFHIQELKAGEIIHFEIPTTVDETDEQKRFENTAYIKSYNENAVDIPSETTYHEKFAYSFFKFTKSNKAGEQLEGADFGVYEKRCDHAHDTELLKVNENGDLSDTEQSKCWKRVIYEDMHTGKGNAVKEFTKLMTSKEYRLVEYKAPAGYVIPEGQWILTYNKEKAQFEISNSIGNPPSFERSGNEWIVRNYTIEELPSTGGRGWGKYMVAGALVMLIAGAGIYRNRNRK